MLESYRKKSICQKSLGKRTRLLPKIFWQNVLLSDETTLELHPNKRVLVRRLPNTGMEKSIAGNVFGRKIAAR